MTNDYITGIQQIGIGVCDANEAKHLYKDLFGMNVLIFEDQAEASLMTRYTGSEIHKRHAILSMNLAGGGGFEIWQFTSRTPTKQIPPRYGDLGIYAAKIKCGDIEKAHKHLIKAVGVSVSEIFLTPQQKKHFYISDPYGNHFNMVEANDWFKVSRSICGGVAGAVIGVSNLQRSVAFYKQVLGIDEVVYETREAPFVAAGSIQTGQQFNSVLLRKKAKLKGAFSRLLGTIEIELVQALAFEPKKMYTDRYWGDCGFIHLCFDVLDMKPLKERAKALNTEFTVDSAESFAMGSSAGRFCYLEDPDGTLIELVETHKIPILKKLNWCLNLRKRKSEGPLPDWMINLLGLNKIR